MVELVEKSLVNKIGDIMIQFDDNELEIALVTYNRSAFVQEWFDTCCEEFCKRNITISVYDSSNDGKTKSIVEAASLKYQHKIKYIYISDQLSVGHVVWEVIKNSKAKYIWPVGDSRRQDIEDLDEKVFPYIKKNYDHIVLGAIDNWENDGTVYRNKHDMLYDCFISMTCTGYYIYRRAIFDPLLLDKELVAECDKKFDGNYGFTWMGYFLTAYSMDEKYETVFSFVRTIDIEPEKKVVRWNKYFFKCWCDDLCNIVDNCADVYKAEDDLLKKVWKYLAFDMAISLYKNCQDGVLNPDIFEKNVNKLKRMSKDVDKIRGFAYAKGTELEKYYEEWNEIEEKQFINKAKYHLEQIMQVEESKKICIYGAGYGGKILLKSLQEQGIEVKCFYDKNADTISEIDGVPVKTLEQCNSGEELILISFYKSYVPIIPELLSRGYATSHIFYIKYMD